MSDHDAPSRPEWAESHTEQRNLPVPRPNLVPRENGTTWFGRIVRALFRWNTGSVRADLKVLLEGAASDTGFSPEESKMLKNILGLRERRLEDVMIPRADIVAVQQNIALGELMKIFENAAHSRLVVYNDTLDDPVGMVHIRDLIAFMTTRAAVSAQAKVKRKKAFPAGLDLRSIDLAMPLSATKIIRTILFVPPSMSALDLLAKMQASHVHLALVIDEYGGTDGIISIEDLVEQIVGEIEDEHDEAAEHSLVRQPDGSFLADGRASLEDVLATVGNEFDVGEAGEEVDTLGGYLVTRVGRVPVRGELVPGPDPFEIEVLDADPRRVKKVKIYRSKQPRTGLIREAERSFESDASRSAVSPPGSAEDSAPMPTEPAVPTAHPAPSRSPRQP